MGVSFSGSSSLIETVGPSTPSFSDLFGVFSPLSLPLRNYTRIVEQASDSATTEYPQGLYFINDAHIQFAIETNGISPYDLEVVENSILLLSDNDALALDTASTGTIFGISDTFLELD